MNHKNIRKVLLENKSGSKAAMESLVQEEVKKVYIISGPLNNYDSSQRISAAMEVAEKYALDVEIIEGDFTEESGYLAGEEMKWEASKTYGIFALNDEMALGIHNYLKEHNQKIGQEVFIRGFDKNQVTLYLGPPIHSVSYSKYNWGAMAVETLEKLIKEENVENKHVETEF